MKPTPPVIWFTGLSGSGKTTLSNALAEKLRSQGIRVSQLDGDDLRLGLSSDLGFSDEDRLENVRRAAHVARIMRNGGALVICSLISPMVGMRDLARQIIGEGFVEVYVNCSIELCAQRDVKGLYAKVTAGDITDMTGIGSDYEPPVAPDIEIRTDNQTVEASAIELLSLIEYRSARS